MVWCSPVYSLGAAVALLLMARGVATQACAGQNTYTPGPTLNDDLNGLSIHLLKGYIEARPRLLFGAKDLDALRGRRQKTSNDLWDALMRQAKGTVSYVPTGKDIREGKKYWRAEWLFSSALMYALTGEVKYRASAVKWMKAHCREKVWGVGWRSNVDLFAAWYSYYIALTYDLLHAELADADREAIRKSLADHARAMYESLKPPQEYRYDQNHTYIPTVALACTALALVGEEDDAASWLKRTYAIMRRCRYVMGDDGYYYEGYGYWRYALHWHVRYADLIARATGEKAHDLPIFKKIHLYALHLSLPAAPWAWDNGDTGKWTGTRPMAKAPSFGWNAHLYRLAALHKIPEARAVADFIKTRNPDTEDPAMHFLWHDVTFKPGDVSQMKPYYYFRDHDVVCWRSSWNKDATVYMFRCGPPQGHAAAKKLKRLQDWTMNSGHVHPDIGMFWMFAKGEYLAVDTGYTQRKRTRDHNTILVDDCAQGMDYNYWVYRNLPYDMFDKAHLAKVHLEDAYGYACGDFGAVYHPKNKVGDLSLKRHVIMTERFLLTLDQIDCDRPHIYTWLQHSDGPFEEQDGFIKTTRNQAQLLTYVLSPTHAKRTIGPSIVFRGRKPHQGKDETVGHQLAVATPTKVKSANILVLLVPRGADQAPPHAVALAERNDKTVRIAITWAPGQTETVALDLTWKQGGNSGPVRFLEAK